MKYKQNCCKRSLDGLSIVINQKLYKEVTNMDSALIILDNKLFLPLYGLLYNKLSFNLLNEI